MSLSTKSKRFAIVISRFNQQITQRLLRGSLSAFQKHRVTESSLRIVWVPGAFEIPLVAAKLAGSKRFNAIICLCSVTPSEFSVSLVRNGLSDKSSRVRTKAADWALRLRLTDVIPDLEQSLAVESHTATKRTITFSLGLLRDGYLLDDNDSDVVSVTVPTSGGIIGRLVSRDDIDTKGIRAVVSEIAAR